MNELFKRYKSGVVFLGDITIFICALIFTILIRYDFNDFYSEILTHIRAFEVLLVLWILVFYAMDLYSYQTWRTTFQNIRKYAIALLANFFISISIFYIFGGFFKLTPKANLLIFVLIFAILDAIWRFYVSKIFSSNQINRDLIIFSSSPLAKEIIEHINIHPQIGYKCEVFSEIEGTDKMIHQNNGQIILIDEIFLKNPEIAKKLYELLAQHIEIFTLTEFYENLFGKIPLSQIKEDWFIQEIKSDKSIYEALKRILDVLFSIFGIVIFSPIFILLFILVPLTSKGGAIYKQIRVGKDEKNFTLYKFRSMYANSEKNPDSNGASPIWSNDNDPRITRFGNILRKTHLDELPQLFNILIGDMSVVGPRPERPEFVQKLKQDIPHYFIRQTIKPGLTGWAQIRYRYTNTIDEVRQKFEFDLYYIKTQNIFLDISIILKTIKLIFS